MSADNENLNTGKSIRDNNDNSAEKRRYIRTDSSIPIMLYVKKGEWNAEGIKAYTRNISATGLMLEAEKELNIENEVRIELEPPDSPNPIHAKCKVVWSSPMPDGNRYYCGLEFTKIEEDNKNTFLKFLCDTIYKSSNNR